MQAPLPREPVAQYVTLSAGSCRHLCRLDLQNPSVKWGLCRCAGSTEVLPPTHVGHEVSHTSIGWERNTALRVPGANAR